MTEEKTILSNNCIRDLLTEAISQIKENNNLSLSDLFLMVSYDDLTLSVFTDDEELLAQGNVDEWDSFKEDSDNFDENIIRSLKETIENSDVKEALENLDVIRPFSVILVDEDFEQKEEIYRIDDSVVVIDDNFLKNIDKELDDFLKDLLSDLK